MLQCKTIFEGMLMLSLAMVLFFTWLLCSGSEGNQFYHTDNLTWNDSV